MKSIIKTIVLIAVTCFLAISCGTNDSEAAYLKSVCCNVEVGSNGTLTFLSDNGETIYLSPESDIIVRDQLGTKMERIHLLIKYNESDMTVVNGKTTIKNAVALDGTQKIIVNTPMTSSVAEEKNWLAKDSLFNIRSINEAYVSNGYLTIIVNAPYSIVNNYSVYPGVNVVIDREEMTENAMTVHLLYNCHSPKTATTYNDNFITSFPINIYKTIVPGSDDINVTVTVEGQDKDTKTTFKMKRNLFN